jgi:hypothetical protein
LTGGILGGKIEKMEVAVACLIQLGIIDTTFGGSFFIAKKLIFKLA